MEVTGDAKQSIGKKKVYWLKRKFRIGRKVQIFKVTDLRGEGERTISRGGNIYNGYYNSRYNIKINNQMGS